MTKQPATKCLFVNCKAPVTHRVFQTWNSKTVHCCDQHIPGSRNPNQTPFYRVEKIADAA